MKHVGKQVAGLDDKVKPLLDFAAVILQDWHIEEVQWRSCHSAPGLRQWRLGAAC